jgi:recombination protein RecR
MMDAFTDSMKRLVEAFGRMPGIGQRTAERLTYYVLRSPKAEMERLAQDILAVKEKVGHCSQCHNITETDPCRICADPRRETSVVCVVEEPKDVFAIEAAGSFRGLYHVLMGRIAPLDGIGPESLEIASLLERVKRGTIKEAIMATNPNLEGDGTALFLSRKLSELGVRVTRLARGLAPGSAIEHANTAILSEAIAGRKEM